MEYLRLGKTNLRLSRLGLGAMSFGDPSWRRWVLPEAESRAIIARALDHGINLIDTSNYYSAGRSEEIVGAAIAETGQRDRLVLATKVGNPMAPWPNGGGFSRKHLFEAVDASLRRLRTDYIDLYQTHIWDRETELEEMVDAFADLVRSGKVLYVGATDMPVWQFVKCVMLAEARGVPGFVSMQHHYNALWREDERELIPFCRAQRIGMLPYSPHGRGLLCGSARRDPQAGTARAASDEYADLWFGRAADRAVADLVESLADARGVKPAQLALAWVLARPYPASVLIGATRPEQIDDAVAALEIAITPEEDERIRNAYALRPAAGHG